jgi:2-polyprenyl-6-methoxyphenol hydroxylase-like FAD-dependent oxidoreductase
MLLARTGHRVLVVDRATFPSDTVSTHVVQPRGVAALARWGLLDRLTATGCPPIHTSAYDFGPFMIAGSPGTTDAPMAYCPRRTILDKLLVDAAAEAGAEVREGFIVDELLTEDGRVAGIKGRAPGGGVVTERANVVIGPTAGIRSSLRPFGPNSTVRSRHCLSPITATGADCPSMAGSRSTFAHAAASAWPPPMTT